MTGLIAFQKQGLLDALDQLRLSFSHSADGLHRFLFTLHSFNNHYLTKIISVQYRIRAMILLIDLLPTLRLVLRYLPVGPTFDSMQSRVFHVYSFGEF